MKLFIASVFVGLVSLVASEDVSDISDYFYGFDATDIAPYSCTSATEYFSCYRPVSAYENCGNVNDPDACYCSSAAIDQSCHSKYCPNLTFDSYDITRYCKASATPVSSPAKTTAASSSASTTSHSSSSTSKSSSSSSSSAGAVALASSSSSSAASATPAALATDSSAQATSTSSSTAASSSPNAGGRSVVVSVGGVVAVVAAAAVAVAGGFA